MASDDLIMTGAKALAPIGFTAGAAGIGLSMTDNPVLGGAHGGGAGAFVLAGSAGLVAVSTALMAIQGK